MKIKNIIVSLFAVSLVLSSCYEDKGNYEYKEINEIDIQGIEDEYARDLDDSLIITPSFVGTQYSDTSKFTYSWIVDGRERSTSPELRVLVNFLTGKREGRITLTDKATQVKTFKKFYIRVSSSTAGDLYMILSKSKGKAELSYLRLDKPSNFAVNYYEERTGRSLGVNPQQLCMIDLDANNSYSYPFTKTGGRFMALIDSKAYLFDKFNLQMDTVTNYLEGETYTGLSSYPKPDVEGYKTEYLLDAVEMWRELANGAQQQGTSFAEISGGAVYKFTYAGNSPSSAKRTYNKKSPYENGYLSPFCYFDDISDAPSSYPWVQGNDLGNIMVFDKTAGRFAFSYYDYVYEIKADQMKAYPGADLMWGTDTNLSTLSIAVLSEGGGGSSRMVLINKAGSASSAKYSVGAEVITSGVINQSTRFYAMKYSSYIFFVTGDKIYNYNILEAINGNAPSERNVVARLSDYGYESGAVITDICVSRSERTMLLGVSRYGNDTEAMDEENKGDLVVLNLNSSTFTLSKKEIFKGVSGIPVDVQIKYQTHYRNGKGKDGSYKDII